MRTAFRLHRPAEGVLDKDGGSGAEKEWGALLAAAQRGDAAAYRAFLESVLPFVRSIVRRRAWSEEMAEDVVQETLLTVHRIRHTYEPGRPVGPWLAAIAARRAVDAMRRQGRHSSREVHDEAAYETFADPQANQFEAKEAAESIARMMTELTPRQKEAIELVKLKELSLAEASARSGQSVASLQVNVHRAIARLRRGLGRKEAE